MVMEMALVLLDFPVRLHNCRVSTVTLILVAVEMSWSWRWWNNKVRLKVPWHHFPLALSPKLCCRWDLFSYFCDSLSIALADASIFTSKYSSREYEIDINTILLTYYNYNNNLCSPRKKNPDILSYILKMEKLIIPIISSFQSIKYLLVFMCTRISQTYFMHKFFKFRIKNVAVTGCWEIMYDTNPLYTPCS